MMPLDHAPKRREAGPLYCHWRIHAEQRQPALLDLGSNDRRARVALIEDGAAFCGSCAAELARGDGAS